MGVLRVKVGGTWIDVPGGAQGPPGPTGPTGATGPAVSDGDKGDVIVSGGGTVWTVEKTAWTNLTLVNSWVAYDAVHTPQYRKIGDIVYLRGLVKNGASATTAFNLPAGFRPSQADETFPIQTSTGLGGISIFNSDGRAVLNGGTAYVYLSGVQFSTA